MPFTCHLSGLILTAALLSSCDSKNPSPQEISTDPVRSTGHSQQDEPPGTRFSAAEVEFSAPGYGVCDLVEDGGWPLHEITQSVVRGDTTIQDAHKKWVDDTTTRCSQPDQDIETCCAEAIDSRIDDISEIPYSHDDVLFEYDKHTDTVRMDGLLPHHVLELAVTRPFNCPDECKDRQLAITHTGTAAPDGWQQNIELPGLDYSLAPDGKILLDSKEIADTPEDLIWVEDFNFDGHQDFAVFSGYAGTKGAQTYHIFLFDPDRNYGFSYAPALSELTYAQIFEVIHDEDGGVLHTFNKDSASSSVSSEWKVVNNVPQEITRFTIYLDHFTEDGRTGTLTISQEWHDGEWHTHEEFTLNEDEAAP